MTGALRIELIRGLHNLRAAHRGCVLTMGKFDGLHRGHQSLLERTAVEASRLGLPATVLSFDPSPREYFRPQKALPRISTLRDELLGLAACGIERLVLARFDARIADLGPEDFLERVLVGQLGMRAIIVGDDLRFGRDRAGGIELLRARGAALGYEVIALDTVAMGGERCSSSAVREALAATDFPRAERLLGHPYRVTGRIRRGLRLGRTLDMPTANIAVRKRLAIPLGVYAVRARAAEKTWNGVASLGIRPTLNLQHCLLETHLFDAQVDLYGQLLQVEFCQFLRGEQKFDSLDSLKHQMHLDAVAARRLLET